MIVELINWIIMIKYILLGIWGLLLLNSCENDDFVWGKEDFARIVGPEIWTRNTDSMTFTFSVYQGFRRGDSDLLEGCSFGIMLIA